MLRILIVEEFNDRTGRDVVITPVLLRLRFLVTVEDMMLHKTLCPFNARLSDAGTALICNPSLDMHLEMDKSATGERNFR